MARSSPYQFGAPGFVGPPSPDDYAKLMSSQAQTPQGPIASPNSYLPAGGPSPYTGRGPMIDPSQVPNVAGTNPGDPGYREAYTRTANNNGKYGYVSKMIRTPEQAALLRIMAMGGMPEQALDPTGQPMTRQDPLTGETTPVYDLQNVKYDPNHPIQQELKGIQDMKDMLALEVQNRKPQLDLSPLMALADSQKPGSHLAESYKAPNNQAMIDKVLSYTDELQKRKADVARATQGEMGPLNGAGTFTDLAQMSLVDRMMQGQQTPRPYYGLMPDQKVTQNWSNRVMGDKDLHDLANESRMAQNAYGLLNAKGEVQDSNFKLALVHMMGIGARITNYELMNELGGPDFMNRANAALQKLTEGKMTDQDRANYTEMIQQQAQRIQQYFAHRAQNWQSDADINNVPQDKSKNLLDSIRSGAPAQIAAEGVKAAKAKTAAPTDAKSKATDELKGLMQSNQQLLQKLNGGK